MNKNQTLFEEFSPSAKEQWEAIARQDLKGKDFEQTLVWNSIEGVKINPYYTWEDIPHLQTLYYRQKNNWEIRQDIKVKSVRAANKKALDALMKGANSLGFLIKEELDEKQLNTLLKDILPEHISINFVLRNNSFRILELFATELKNRNINTVQVRGSVNFDPLGNLAEKRRWYNNKAKDWEDTEMMMKAISGKLPGVHGININGEYYHNSGASIVQELAFSLCQANEYLVHLTDKNFNIDDITARIRFTFSVGANYLMEIAKIRAARILWAKIVEQYHPQHNCSAHTFIHCTTSQRSLMVEDSYTNILRATTQAMSAVIGGADSVCIIPFDAAYQETDNFSERVARNIQLIIGEEAYLGKVADPASGSYYIETLTDSIANAAWELFKYLEKQGGFIAALENDFIHSELAKTDAIRKENIATGKTVLVGVNKYKKK